MKHLSAVFILICFTSCLKTDVLNQPEDINFLKTNFYQERFDDFSFEIIKVDYYEPLFSITDSTYLTAVTYKLPEGYMNELFDVWPHKVELEFSHNTRRLKQGEYILTDTIGRRRSGNIVEFEGTLKVMKIFKVMAQTTHSESFVVK